MQSVSFRIWTRVAVSISYDDNHYSMGTSYQLTVVWKLLNEQNNDNDNTRIRTEKWHKIHRNFVTQTDHQISARISDQVMINKKREPVV